MKNLLNEMKKTLCSTLDIIKNFSTGNSTNIDNKIIINYKEKRYLATFTEIENPNIDIFKDIDKYCK